MLTRPRECFEWCVASRPTDLLLQGSCLTSSLTFSRKRLPSAAHVRHLCCKELVVSEFLFLPLCAWQVRRSLRASLAVGAHIFWLGAGDVMFHAACRHNRTSDAKPCSYHFCQAGLFWRPGVHAAPLRSWESAVKDSGMRTP